MLCGNARSFERLRGIVLGTFSSLERESERRKSVSWLTFTLSSNNLPLVLKDLKLKTEIPLDNEGRARFPIISNLDDASRSHLRQVYEDFMTVIWCESCDFHWLNLAH